MNERTILEAVRDGLIEEMRRDPLVWAVGEDLHFGGLYGQYKGLIDEFGPTRIVASPISEAMIVSAGLGGALAGTRPVVEMRIADFALPAIDEIVNQTAKARFMFGGQARVPVVMRLPQGLMASSAAQHSQSLESWYVHVPGLVVLAPSTPADCKGLLKSAIRCDDPVIFIEPRANWQMRGEVPDDTEHLVPIGRARIARAGSDLTVISWSAMTPVAMKAAESASERGLDVEVIDLRSLWPWDRETVFASVERTGRLLVVHEAVQVCGLGAEIVASVAETIGPTLRRPPRRLGAPRAPVAFSPPLEAVYRVTAEKIGAAMREMVQA
jgi:acetoin:2,6-dichlorophenolindophenol oxidoreductase subunit beta